MVKKKSAIIIFCLIVAVYIGFSSGLYFYKKYNDKNNAIDIVFLSKLNHVKYLTLDNKRSRELFIESIAEAEALSNFTSYYKNNEELYQSISMLYDLELSNEKFQPYYSEIQAYIQKLYSNPNDKDIAKEFLKFLKEINVED